MHVLSKPNFKKGIQSITYPALIFAGLSVYFALIDLGFSNFLASTLPVVICLAVILALETKLPYRKEWSAKHSDIKTDIPLLILIQMVAPKLLGLAVGLLLAQSAMSLDALDEIWPKHWNILSQTLLMVLLADLLRYWLHVAAHKIPLFWKFHAIHHQPKKLYSINVGRFHPIEKTIQFLFDSLPFILLGVTPEVIACYFVFYAINGFIQHSNINLKFGLLNFIASSSELHRWHHAEDPSIANCNYGNNLIIWDLVFRTYYLPRNNSGPIVGIKGVEPLGFIDSFGSPFIGTPRIKTKLINLAVSLLYKLAELKYWRKFEGLCEHTETTQNSLLEEILARQADTTFGRNNGFSAITNYQEYRDKVEVQNYEGLRPLIEKQALQNSLEITHDPAILYAQTSGSTGRPKYIPVTKHSLAQLKISQTLSSLMMYRACPEAFNGKMLTIVSPAEEGYNEWGKLYGSASGLIVKNSPEIIKKKCLLPFETFEIQNHDLKYDLILLIALAEENITFMGTANPSTLLHLLNLINQKTDYFLEILSGNIEGIWHKCASESENKILAAINCSEQRLVFLERLLAANQNITFADLWPKLRLIVTWTGGSCGIPLDSVASSLPKSCKVMDAGYLASEFRGTITHSSTQLGIPTLHENFFEFVEKQSREDGVNKFLRLHELENNRQYYIFVTNQNGLYRYDMCDIVEVSGYFKKTPCLRFVQKGKGTTNITGEKLYESQLISTLKTLALRHNIHPTFYVCLADELASRYELFVETSEVVNLPQKKISIIVDNLLADNNIEYKTKRASNRLKKLVVKLLQPGTFEIYKKKLVEEGQRESQFKVMTLQYCRENKFSFSEHLIS